MQKRLSSLLTTIVSNPTLHGKWLNTLSYLENCGARKIAACEHPTLVKEEVLKHASEEFRHSHYLKRQIRKVTSFDFPSYAFSFILGGNRTLRYLDKLDLWTSRYLRELGCDRQTIKQQAYLFVTYAIELRAREVYPIYDAVLRSFDSNVFVKSIILEEEGHLQEMEEGIEQLSHGMLYAQHVASYENDLFLQWISTLEKAIG